MTRRSAAANSNHNNGDEPPPSTYAAQLVQNQTRHAASQQPGETAPFAQLLHEILHDQNAAQELDVNVNAQLIAVVTELGLAPVNTENPFADQELLLSQAADSLAVIETTVKRQPGVLLLQIAPDGPQLLLSLLAALIALCGRPKCEKLPIGTLLASATVAFECSIDSWQYARTLREVVRECVDGTWPAVSR